MWCYTIKCCMVNSHGSNNIFMPQYYNGTMVYIELFKKDCFILNVEYKKLTF